MSDNRQAFRMGTRQRIQKVGTIPFAAGASGQPLELPRVGLASKIIVQFRGSITFSGNDVNTDQGPFNLVNRFRVLMNNGSAQIVDISGYGAYLASKWQQRGFMNDNAGAGATTPHVDIHKFALTTGAHADAVLTYELPLAANDSINFETGLLNLQASETRVTIEAVFGALTDAGALITDITGNLHVYYEYYEIPDPREYFLPPLALVRTLEEQMVVGATGEVIYQIPHQGTLLQLIHVLTLNGARSDSVDSLLMRFNKTDTVYNEDRQLNRLRERIQYGTNPITGVFYRDYWAAMGIVSGGDTRDAIDTEEMTTLESIVNVTSGATFGSNNNKLTSIRRIVQVLEA